MGLRDRAGKASLQPPWPGPASSMQDHWREELVSKKATDIQHPGKGSFPIGQAPGAALSDPTPL